MLLFDSRVKTSQGILNSQALAKGYDKQEFKVKSIFKDNAIFSVANNQLSIMPL
jgi:hypothetical protein